MERKKDGTWVPVPKRTLDKRHHSHLCTQCASKPLILWTKETEQRWANMHQILRNTVSRGQNKDAKSWEQRCHSFQSLLMEILEKDLNNMWSVDPYILPTPTFKNRINRFPFYLFGSKDRSLSFPWFHKQGVSSPRRARLSQRPRTAAGGTGLCPGEHLGSWWERTWDSTAVCWSSGSQNTAVSCFFSLCNGTNPSPQMKITIFYCKVWCSINISSLQAKLYCHN